jgi:hypothetical protein
MLHCIARGKTGYRVRYEAALLTHGRLRRGCRLLGLSYGLTATVLRTHNQPTELADMLGMHCFYSVVRTLFILTHNLIHDIPQKTRLQYWFTT